MRQRALLEDEEAPRQLEGLLEGLTSGEAGLLATEREPVDLADRVNGALTVVGIKKAD